MATPAAAQRSIMGCEEAVERAGIDVAYGVRSRSHGRCGSWASYAACDGVFTYPVRAVGRQPGGAFPATSARACGNRTLLVQFLLVSKQQVSPCEAARACRALERLLFCVRPLMALQML